jgi:hypothetical protein
MRLLSFRARCAVGALSWSFACSWLVGCSTKSNEPGNQLNGPLNGGSGADNRAGASAGGNGAAGGTLSNAGAPGSGGSGAGHANAGAGGSTGAQGGAGAGGSMSNGGAPGGAGGASGAGGAVSMAGSAGSLSTAGGAGGAAAGAGGAAAGTSGAGGAGTAGGAADCSGLPLCDSFESTAVGAAPNSALWTIVPMGASSATVDSIGAHGSSHSLKVVSSDRLYLRNSSVIGTLGSSVHVRFYVRFAATLGQGHGAMIVTHPTMVDQYSQSNELRFGGQDQVFHWNTDSDAANIPDVSPNGDMASVKPMPNTWYCIELTINTNGNLSTSIDGMDIPGLKEDGMPTPDIDQNWVNSADSLARYKMLADFNFGWQSYGAGALTLWYDDVALSASPIGCQ